MDGPGRPTLRTRTGTPPRNRVNAPHKLAVVLVTLEEQASSDYASLRARLLATREVQQCYDVAGEWDYVVVVVTSGMDECRELVEHLFLDEPGVKRFVTLPVFEAVKVGLDIPVRRAADR